jgi:hypothetical protein
MIRIPRTEKPNPILIATVSPRYLVIACCHIADVDTEFLIAKYAKECIQDDNCSTFEYIYSDVMDVKEEQW